MLFCWVGPLAVPTKWTERFVEILSDRITLAAPAVEKQRAGRDAAEQANGRDERARCEGAQQKADKAHADAGSVGLDTCCQRTVQELLVTGGRICGLGAVSVLFQRVCVFLDHTSLSHRMAGMACDNSMTFRATIR